LLIGAGILLANPISNQVERFQRDVPSIIDSANQRLDDLQASFDKRGINVKVKTQGESALQTLQEKVIGGTSDIVSFGGDLLTRLVRASLGLILIVVLSVYMLIYAQRIGALVRAVMPPGDGTPEDDFPTRAQAAVAGYVRGQMLFSLAMGTGAGLGLYLYGLLGIFPDGRTYAFAFGIFFGLMELVPFVGPILGALPPILVALFQDPLTAVWVGLLFLALQQIEGHVVAPQIFGHALRINPLFVIFALLFGAEVYGAAGALVALPIAAMTRETVVYLRRHLVFEPWGQDPLMVDGVFVITCHECGARAGRHDAYCRTCGASLAPAEVASGR
jgi:predicted PurR-regulated permease PerM